MIQQRLMLSFIYMVSYTALLSAFRSKFFRSSYAIITRLFCGTIRQSCLLNCHLWKVLQTVRQTGCTSEFLHFLHNGVSVNI